MKSDGNPFSVVRPLHPLSPIPSRPPLIHMPVLLYTGTLPLLLLLLLLLYPLLLYPLL